MTLSNLGGKAKGSIVETLEILKPMLPEQFFPDILKYSFLRKVQKSLPPDIVKWKHLGELARYNKGELMKLLGDI